MGELKIDIKIDKEKKTLAISDTGIGMTEEEIDKYLNQVAFSGAEEFLEKYKGQNEANKSNLVQVFINFIGCHA